MTDERPWPELVVQRRWPGLPKIINPSTLHMDPERQRYIPADSQADLLGELRLWLGKAEEAETNLRDAAKRDEDRDGVLIHGEASRTYWEVQQRIRALTERQEVENG